MGDYWFQSKINILWIMSLVKSNLVWVRLAWNKYEHFLYSIQDAAATRLMCGNPTQKREKQGDNTKRKVSNRTRSLWYSLWAPLLWLHCKETKEQTQALEPSGGGGSAEVFLFHRNTKFTAQQRGLDFALVQARHSSKVISYFATKATSATVRPGFEKQSASAGI